ncbi:MAG TPA: carbon storage regulator CsrA [Armatimonadota bacterium]
MLILARKIGQRIVIGNNINITVVEVRGDQVRLGVTAPRDITVHRQELWDQICAENDPAPCLPGAEGVPAHHMPAES